MVVSEVTSAIVLSLFVVSGLATSPIYFLYLYSIKHYFDLSRLNIRILRSVTKPPWQTGPLSFKPLTLATTPSPVCRKTFSIFWLQPSDLWTFPSTGSPRSSQRLSVSWVFSRPLASTTTTSWRWKNPRLGTWPVCK